MPDTSLKMRAQIIDRHNIHFHNEGKVPSSHLVYKLFGFFYKDQWTYSLSYWFGCLGTVTFGPDILHTYMMFALRPTADGKTEGQVIYMNKKRKGFLGWLVNWVIVFITFLGDNYFGMGDTKVFQTIKFNLQRPLPLDKTVLTYINHLENQHYTELSETLKSCVSQIKV